jgi:hypothetical protein
LGGLLEAVCQGASILLCAGAIPNSYAVVALSTRSRILVVGTYKAEVACMAVWNLA